MKAIKFKKCCTFNGQYYDIGDELKNVSKVNKADLIRINEKGFIEPLTIKEIEELQNGSFFNYKKNKIEEEKQ